MNGKPPKGPSHEISLFCGDWLMETSPTSKQYQKRTTSGHPHLGCEKKKGSLHINLPQNVLWEIRLWAPLIAKPSRKILKRGLRKTHQLHTSTRK